MSTPQPQTPNPYQPALDAPPPPEAGPPVQWGPPRPRARVLRAARRAAIVTHGSTWTRRLLPTPAAFAMIDLIAWWAQRARAAMWQENVRFHEQLLCHTRLRGSEGEVARRAISEFFQCGEIFWRPWLMARGEIAGDGLEVFRQAQAQGRGVVTVFPHFGMPYAQFPIMHRYGLDAWVVASPHHYEDLGNGYDARFGRRGRAYVDLLGAGRGIPRAEWQAGAKGVFPRVLEQLRAGCTVSIAFDVVGSLQTPFLGRMLSLTSGPARLAHMAGAVVLPFVNRRRGAIPLLQFGAPLEPRDFPDDVALQAAIAAQMEAWALELPEAVWQLYTQPGGPPLIRGPAFNGAGASQGQPDRPRP